MNEKKKSPFIVRLFKGILIFLCVILVSLFGWIGFSALDRMSPLDVIPSDYSVFVHTDSLWDAVSPIVDLKAAVRYLKANDKTMAGDARKIISNGTSAGGALSSIARRVGQPKRLRRPSEKTRCR